MSRSIQKPVERKGDGNEKIITHPAFAQIGVNRVQGGAYLYGSDFQHQHYMTISIRRSEIHRDLCQEWNFGGEELISISLSEAQWATFISSANVGSGVACTLERVGVESVPRLPRPEAAQKRFQEDLKGFMLEMQEDLRELASKIDGPLNKTNAMELKKRMDLIAHRLTGSTGFVAEKFDEHIEKTVEKAKIEINAYSTNLIQRAGVTAIQNGLGVITYPGGEVDVELNE